MATPTATFEGIRSQLKNRKYAPIYILHGEEGFFIDELVKEFEAIVAPEERDFNLYTLYAPQVDMGTALSYDGRLSGGDTQRGAGHTVGRP